MKLTATLVAGYTLLLLISGLVLLFAPEVFVPQIGSPTSESLVLAQLFGASCLGFAAANWTARGIVLGGIYGRPIVVGNQAFAFVGVLVLVRSLPASPGLARCWVLFVLTFGALLFTVLMFRPSWLQKTKVDSSR